MINFPTRIDNGNVIKNKPIKTNILNSLPKFATKKFSDVAKMIIGIKNGIIKINWINLFLLTCNENKAESIEIKVMVGKEIINKQPKIDILVNNAGNNIPEHFTKVKTKNMEYLVKINTMATFNLAQLCALKMIKSKNRKKIGGAIVNMSSQMGHVGGPIRSVYNMTKFGLEGLTKGMSIDLARYNIRVNTVCPTFVVTPMTKKFLKSKKFKREVLENIPLGKFAELSDVASAAVFLASDAASMVTGTSLLVDGGWTAK